MAAQSQDARLTPGETEGFFELPGSAGGPPGAAEVALAGGRGLAVWEITAGEPNAAEASTGRVRDLPGRGSHRGTATVAMGLAPGMDAAVHNRASPGPVPRFDGSDTTQAQLLQVIPCPAPVTPTPTPGTATLSELRISPRRFRAAPRAEASSGRPLSVRA